MKGDHTHPSNASLDSGLLDSEGKLELQKVWQTIQEEALQVIHREPNLRPLMEDIFISRQSLAHCIAARLSRKLAREDMSREEILPILENLLTHNPDVIEQMLHDLIAIHERDPACTSLIQPLLYYKGFKATATYRISHQLWKDQRCDLALYFQSLSSEIFGVDIHPAASIGCGIFLDHATSVVIGETAIVEDHVSILHEVTLGGTGKTTGDRHPIIRSGVLIGAGAKILGRVEVGKGSKIGAGSVVLSDVPAHKTVAGVPAVIVGESSTENPALAMDQSLSCSRL